MLSLAHLYNSRVSTQSYATHTHLPVATSLGYVFVLIAIAGFILNWRGAAAWTFALGIAGLIGAIVTLLAISRLYIVRLQDRIIKLEMNVRCATLLTAEQQRLLAALTNRQLVALRFASDEELPALLERTAREFLEPDQIKRAVRTWRPDYDRT